MPPSTCLQGPREVGLKKDKASLAMEFFMCFLNVVPYKEVFFVSSHPQLLKSKKYCVMWKTDA